MFEIFIFGSLILGVLIYNNTINTKKFAKDNEKLLKNLREEDYEFLVYMKYGTKADPDVLFQKRISTAAIGGAAMMVLFLNSFSMLNIVVCFVVAYFVFKSNYMNLKSYYKRHLHEIDIMLPYYLKSLEILVQHYTVPVAIGKSIEDAPEIFQPGLKKMVDRINAGDASVDPYMEFANTYPVRDSMRMMRLLYRLGIGSQERKQERLMMFSRSVSSLQQKARETKYKERLEKMESQTMVMLVCTGVFVMLILLIAMMGMFGSAM